MLKNWWTRRPSKIYVPRKKESSGKKLQDGPPTADDAALAYKKKREEKRRQVDSINFDIEMVSLHNDGLTVDQIARKLCMELQDCKRRFEVIRVRNREALGIDYKFFK